MPSLPGYEVLRVLGRGGMGIVYEAISTRLNRLVPIKMIIGGAYLGEEAVLRLLNEAEAVAKLHHPNIVADLPGGRSRRPLFPRARVSRRRNARR